MATCERCGDSLDGTLAHALGWCVECDHVPGAVDAEKAYRHHGFIVAACEQRGATTGCRGALRWWGPSSDGSVLCEAHWLVADGFGYRDALDALGRSGGEG